MWAARPRSQVREGGGRGESGWNGAGEGLHLRIRVIGVGGTGSEREGAVGVCALLTVARWCEGCGIGAVGRARVRGLPTLVILGNGLGDRGDGG